jgi:hypothetical protein
MKQGRQVGKRPASLRRLTPIQRRASSPVSAIHPGDLHRLDFIAHVQFTQVVGSLIRRQYQFRSFEILIRIGLDLRIGTEDRCVVTRRWACFYAQLRQYSFQNASRKNKVFIQRKENP